MVKTVFWLSVFFVFYVYFGYPLLLAAWRQLAGRKPRKRRWEPSVSILIAAHDERERIERKILNCLDLDYPREKMQIVVALDAPTDGTEDVVWKYAGKAIDVAYYWPHRGKAGALNIAAAAATGDILIFADARQRIARNAVRELVANFADSEVGGVSGDLVLLDETGHEAADGVGLYWRYEKSLRAMEGDVHSVLGATGALYAIRRELFRPVPNDTILDDVAIPMNAVLAGRRVVFDPDARVYDTVAASPREEYGRKVRTLMGNYQLIARMPEVLLPFRNPVFVQFVSHKVGRLAAPYGLAAIFVSNLFLLEGAYLAFLSAQSAWYALACAGPWLSRLLPQRQPVRCGGLARELAILPAAVAAEGRKEAA